MLRRVALPLALLVVALMAFAWAAASFADTRDLAGLYLAAVGLVALRAQQRITAGLT
jgi:hypothetical protein